MVKIWLWNINPHFDRLNNPNDCLSIFDWVTLLKLNILFSFTDFSTTFLLVIKSLERVEFSETDYFSQSL